MTRLILRNSAHFKQNLRLPRDASIVISFPSESNLFKHIENYLTEIRTMTRLHNIQLSNQTYSPTKFSFRDHLIDDIQMVFNLSDDEQTKELVRKHEERLSKQVDKYHDDLNNNEMLRKAHEEKQDQENFEREQRRREVLIDELKLTQQRHETFVELAQQRTVIEKKPKTKKRSN